MQDKLIENIMEGFYQAHPQGEELLKLDLAECARLHEVELRRELLEDFPLITASMYEHSFTGEAPKLREASEALEQFREQTDQTPVTKIEKDK